jgi:hypothetical protein
MKSNAAKKIDAFARHHLFLSSFVCLMILSVILNFYMGYALPISSLLPNVVERLINLIVPSIIGTFFFSTIPILVVSSILFYCLKKKAPVIPDLSYSKKFSLSFIPTLAIILFFLIRIAQYASSSYANPPYPYHFAIITSFVYSVIFAAFFGWLTDTTKLKIIVQCIIISILMALLNKLIYEFGASGPG